jgi:8-oxo-dGTP pyrophosphatase MutT (NUDIX family)
MGYVSDLRKKVGHMPCVVAFSVMVLIDGQNNLLLEERSDDGYWDFPGGSIEINETAEDAARRELKEETGIAVKDITLLGVYSGLITYYKYHNGDEVSGVDLVYLCRKFDGVLFPQKEEVRKLVWFPIDKTPGKMSLRNKKIVVDLLSKLPK